MWNPGFKSRIILLCLFAILSLYVSSGSQQSALQASPLSSLYKNNTILLHRSKRSWEWTIDAIKCTLKIVSIQVSRKFAFYSSEIQYKKGKKVLTVRDPLKQTESERKF